MSAKHSAIQWQPPPIPLAKYKPQFRFLTHFVVRCEIYYSLALSVMAAAFLLCIGSTDAVVALVWTLGGALPQGLRVLSRMAIWSG